MTQIKTLIQNDADTAMYINPMGLTNCLPQIDYHNGELYIEQVAVKDIATQYGTPCYVYSRTALVDAYRQYSKALADVNHQICYAVKANSNLAVLSTLVKVGAGFDIVSIGELARVLAAGGDANKVVYSGVGKTSKDVEYALQKGVGCFNVESVAELSIINDVAKKLGKQANISLRVNPNVDAKTHPYISTGLKDNKFGIAHEQAVKTYKTAQQLSHLNIVGIDCHIGSQLTQTEPFVAALDKLIELIDELKQNGITLKHIDLGGGLGVQYIDEQVDSIAELIALIVPKVKQLGLQLMLEPGRSIVANAGVLLTKVDVLKPSEHKNFAVVDAAMNDLIRPALYQAEMGVIPTSLNEDAAYENTALANKTWDIVGAVCETGDFLAKNRILNLQTGDVLAVTGAGAYGFVMSSNYNTRTRAAEVMVNGSEHKVVRKRESIEQLFANEVVW
ncbi:MAG: diaminopimelate decarboxylase [Gammaproteobacteria bacterium]|nr:MAG: diaminopimelate decarboxylase [Gammaproteobacteria bacterium]